MPIETGMYSLSNQINPVKIAQEGQDLGVSREETGMKLQQLGMQTQQAKDAFNDQQAVRAAMKQNVDAQGNLDKHSAVVQIAQQNPLLAKQIDTQMMKSGVEGAAAHAERMQQFFANSTPETYAQDKQKLIDEGFQEAKQLPDIYVPSSMQRGLIASGTASQQMDIIKAQAQHEFELKKAALEKGIDYSGVGPSLYDIYGRNKLPGLNRIPGGEMDQKGLKIGTDELKARTEQSDYVTAQNNLLAGKNFMSLVNKGDPNKMSNQQLTLAAAELGKMAASKSPTDSDMEHLTPENRFTMQAKWLSRISGKPEAANQGEFIEQMKEYAQDLIGNSAEVLRAHHKQAYDMALAGGASPETANRFSAANEQKVKSLIGSKSQSQQKQPALTGDDKRAVDWARDNPKDDYAKQILKLHGLEK